MRTFMALGFVFSLTISCNQRGLAEEGGFKVRLPKNNREQVEYYMAQPRVQIIPTGPIVSDHRQADDSTSYDIVVPPMPSGGGNGTITVGPSGSQAGNGGPNGGNGGVGAPGRITIPGSKGLRAGGGSFPAGSLPTSRLNSNLPPNGAPSAPRGLPAGFTTGIYGSVAPAKSAVPNNAVIRVSGPGPGTTPPAASTRTMTYQSPLSSSNSGGQIVRTNVNGEVVKSKLLQRVK